MNYDYKNLKIRHLPDRRAEVAVYDAAGAEYQSQEISEADRPIIARIVAGPDYRVVAKSSEFDDDSSDRSRDVAGNCPSCKSPRLMLNKFGHIVCRNTQCALPGAASQILVDPDLRCRCGYLKTDDNDTCEWHRSRTEREHLGWVVVRAEEAAMLRSDQDAVAEMISTVNELIEELRLSVEYVGIDVLQPYPGWGWYDALKKHMPQFDEWLAKMPSRGTAHLAAEIDAIDNLANVLTTLRLARTYFEGLDDTDFDNQYEVHTEQLDRLIHACEQRLKDSNAFSVTPAENVEPEAETYEQREYPHPGMGDTVVLGPEIFADTGGTVINWKGENYYPRPEHPRWNEPAGERAAHLTEVFKKAWHAADERGEAGSRTLHGIRSVLDTLDDTMTGQRVKPSDVRLGDWVLGFFTEDSKAFVVNGEVRRAGNGSLYVGSNRICGADGTPGDKLSEVRIMRRATPDPDPAEIEAVRQVLRDARDHELGSHWDELKVAIALVRRNVRKVDNDDDD